MPRFTKGHRKVGGRKPGTKTKAVVMREMDAERYRRVAREQLERLQGVQFQQAVGLHFVEARDSEGRWVRLTDPDMILLAQNTGDEGKVWRITTKDPDTQMSKYITDQAIGRAPETQRIEVSGPDGGPVVYTWQR